MRRRGLATAGVAAGVAAAMSPFALSQRAVVAQAPAYGAQYFTDAVVTTHEGQKLRFYTDLLRGRRALINFVFVGCTDICDSVTANLVAVQDLLGSRIGSEITMISISLLPDFDTPEVLKLYAGRFGVRPGWHFLTGALDEVEVLRRRLGFADSDPVLDADIFQHAASLRIGDEPLQRWTMAPALLSPESLVETINRVFTPRHAA